jgi:hypothetical protein
MTRDEWEAELIRLKTALVTHRWQMPHNTPFCDVPAKLKAVDAVLDECLNEYRQAGARGKVIPKPE